MFKRTYLGHGTQSSVFVFQGHPGPFRTHVHTTHDEIGYVLEGTGQVTVGGVTRPVKKGDVWVIPANTPHGGAFEDAPQVLFISSPIDDPDNQDRVWIDGPPRAVAEPPKVAGASVRVPLRRSGGDDGATARWCRPLASARWTQRRHLGSADRLEEHWSCTTWIRSHRLARAPGVIRPGSPPRPTRARADLDPAPGTAWPLQRPRPALDPLPPGERVDPDRSSVNRATGHACLARASTRVVAVVEVGRHVPGPGREHRGLDPAAHAQLVEDVGHVHAGRLGADEQLLGDLAIVRPAATRASTSASRADKPMLANGVSGPASDAAAAVAVASGPLGPSRWPTPAASARGGPGRRSGPATARPRATGPSDAPRSARLRRRHGRRRAAMPRRRGTGHTRPDRASGWPPRRPRLRSRPPVRSSRPGDSPRPRRSVAWRSLNRRPAASRTRWRQPAGVLAPRPPRRLRRRGGVGGPGRARRGRRPPGGPRHSAGRRGPCRRSPRGGRNRPPRRHSPTRAHPHRARAPRPRAARTPRRRRRSRQPRAVPRRRGVRGPPPAPRAHRAAERPPHPDRSIRVRRDGVPCLSAAAASASGQRPARYNASMATARKCGPNRRSRPGRGPPPPPHAAATASSTGRRPRAGRRDWHWPAAAYRRDRSRTDPTGLLELADAGRDLAERHQVRTQVRPGAALLGHGRPPRPRIRRPPRTPPATRRTGRHPSASRPAPARPAPARQSAAGRGRVHRRLVLVVGLFVAFRDPQVVAKPGVQDAGRGVGRPRGPPCPGPRAARRWRVRSRRRRPRHGPPAAGARSGRASRSRRHRSRPAVAAGRGRPRSGARRRQRRRPVRRLRPRRSTPGRPGTGRSAAAQ